MFFKKKFKQQAYQSLILSSSYLFTLIETGAYGMVVETNSEIQYLMKQVRMLLISSTVLAITLIITSCSKEQNMIQAAASSAPPKDSITKAATAPTAATSAVSLKSFSFSEIPFGNPDLVNPGRGAEQWHDRTDVDVANYRPNIRLAVNGRNADGSYTMLEKVLVR